MTRLTCIGKQIILKAAEYIEVGTFYYSCHAIAYVESGFVPNFENSQLCHKYAKFYNQLRQLWRCERFGTIYREDKEWRILCLLTFAELG